MRTALILGVLVPKYSLMSLYEVFNLPSLERLKQTLVTIKFFFLNILFLYSNSHSSLLKLKVFRVSISNTSTHSTTSLISLPYAPMLPTIPAPTVPGMKDMFSMPYNSFFTASLTTSSQLSPAFAITLSLSNAIPFSSVLITKPLNPSSDIKTLEP